MAEYKVIMPKPKPTSTTLTLKDDEAIFTLLLIGLTTREDLLDLGLTVEQANTIHAIYLEAPNQILTDMGIYSLQTEAWNRMKERKGLS